MTLDSDLASAFARVALANVRREYPHKLDHLLDAPPRELMPRSMHPAFYGSFDWHSAVHMHWLLVRLLRVQADLQEAADIVTTLDAHLAHGPLAIEQGYFAAPGRRSFERPYGWAWLLELQAETLRLSHDRAEGRRWAQALDPFARYIAGRMREFLALAVYPIRVGTHSSTAFACILALDYARTAGDAALVAAIASGARQWHSADRDAPIAYEPSLADFLSPALTEAQLMREVLSQEAFRAWLAAFLPTGLGLLATPPVVPDRSDAHLSHLDGLSLSRAWALQRIAAALPAGEAHEFRTAAQRHLDAGLPHVVGGDYAGEHWLASFAALALGEAP